MSQIVYGVALLMNQEDKILSDVCSFLPLCNNCRLKQDLPDYCQRSIRQ